MYIAFDDKEFSVLFNEIDVNYVVVFFSPYDPAYTGVENFWAKRFIQKNNINSIVLIPKSPNWYPPECVNKIISSPKLNDLSIKYSVILGYGTSMGGYGALKYGRVFGLTNTVAFSPQYSIFSDDLEIVSKYQNRYNPKLHHVVAITHEDLDGVNVEIYFDEQNQEDSYHAKKILAINHKVNLIKVNYLGHKVVKAVASSKKLLLMIDSIVKGDFAYKVFNKKWRYDVDLYFAILSKSNYKKRPLLSLSIALKGLALYPNSIEIKYSLSLALGKLKRFDDALIVLGELVFRRPLSVKIRVLYIDYFLKSARYKDAIDNLSLFISSHRDCDFIFHKKLIIAYALSGDVGGLTRSYLNAISCFKDVDSHSLFIELNKNLINKK